MSVLEWIITIAVGLFVAWLFIQLVVFAIFGSIFAKVMNRILKDFK